MSHLAVSMLGSMQVTRDGEPVARFRGDTVQALLAYLAMHPGIVFRRQVLAGLLWPDHPESEALVNLRQALRRLRTAIADDEANPPFLVASRTTLTLDPESDYWLDVAAFDQALSEARSHAHAHLERCPSCAQQLAEAVELYRGDFLQGFSLDSALFEEWMVVERERLHLQVLEALGHLAACYEESGEYERALAYARRQVELEPWRESAHRQWMRALALSGKRGAALAQYEACRRILADELGVEPGPETAALYARIREGAELTLGIPPPPHNLPAQLTPFIGREAELAEIAERLADPACRLLTLVGPGGSGKTRLALEAAARQLDSYPDGVFFVSLAPLQSVEAIVPAIAQAIGFAFYSGGEPSRRSVGEQLLNYLRHKNVLLVLDNYEHLLQGAGLVSEILRVAPEVVALVTSRGGLHVQGEYRFPVSGMSYPALIPPTEDGRPGEDALQYSAIRLFAASALRAQPNLDLTGQALADVVRICQLVDGIPLAIVLASAWVEMLTPAEIARELAPEIEGQMSGLGLDVLEAELGDVPERQRSMRAVFDHSWRLLPTRGQEILAGLSVFRGGFTREAAQQVTGTSLRALMTLVNRSLLHRAPTGRYEVHELLRQYAAEKLAQSPDAGEAAHDRHCAHYAQFLAQRRDTFRKRGAGDAVVEMANIRAAWEWALQHGRLPEIRRSLEGIWWLSYSLGIRKRETGILLARAVDLLRRAEPTRENRLALGLALCYLSVSLNWAGLPEAASPLAQEGLSLVRRLGTGRVLALGHTLAFYTAVAKDATQARQLLEQGLGIAQEADSPLEACLALNSLAWLALWHDQYDEAERHWLTFLRIAREIDHRTGRAISLGGLGNVAHFRGQHARARAYYEQSLAIFRELGERVWTVKRLNDLGDVTLASGDLEQARARYRQALSSSEEIADLMQVARALCGLGEVALAAGDVLAARRRCRRVLQVAMEDQHANMGREALISAARLVAHRGERERAVELVALALCERSSFPGEALAHAEAFLRELRSGLSPDVYAVAQERGRQRDLWATVEELLAELEEQQVL